MKLYSCQKIIIIVIVSIVCLIQGMCSSTEIKQWW